MNREYILLTLERPADFWEGIRRCPRGLGAKVILSGRLCVLRSRQVEALRKEAEKLSGAGAKEREVKAEEALGLRAKKRKRVFWRFMRKCDPPEVYHLPFEVERGEPCDYRIPCFKICHVEGALEGQVRYLLKRDIAFSYDAAFRISLRLEGVPEELPSEPPSFEELLSVREEEALRLLGDPELAKLAAYLSLGLGKLYPLLVDEKVEEVYADGPSKPVYIDHREWSRCRTNITLNMEDFRRLAIRLKLESGFRLDYANPSLKTDLRCRDFVARFSLDVRPLTYDPFYLDIRKHRTSVFTIPELISKGTLTEEAAAYLYFCLVRRRNITLVGPPNSGKTTLANALDMLVPFPWRRLYVEDVHESLDLGSFAHQAKFSVCPVESGSFHRMMGKEVVKLLHRSPDWIFLGEIQTMEQTKAMFHALSAGLRGIQTFHASSLQQLVNRWLYHYRIPPSCVLDLDVIVHMERDFRYGRVERKVVGIYEPSLKNGELTFVKLFAWDPSSASLRPLRDLYSSPTLSKVREVEYMSRENFEKEFRTYARLFSALVELRIFDMDSVLGVVRRFWEVRARGAEWEVALQRALQR